MRVFDWVDRLRWSVNEKTYTDSASINLRAYLRAPGALADAEAQMRNLRNLRPERLLLSRRASPFSSGRLEASILRSAKFSVYDFDDALWLSRRRLFALASTWKRSVEAADVVIAGNDMLATAARELSDRVVMIPSCVEPAAYAEKQSYDISIPTVGWIGSPSTEKYLLGIARPLLELHHEYGLRLKVISAGKAQLGELDKMIDRVEWTSRTFSAELGSVDVGIMPLDDSDWSRGKCAYKLLQYGASALPVVASGVGANRLALDRMGGYSARSDSEWYAGVKSLLTMTTTDRARKGKSGREAIQAHYSYDAWQSTWVDTVLGTGG